MLKIKDNVDLKELEKFGFWQWENTWGTYTIDKQIATTEEADLFLYEYDRIINFEENSNLNVLYDLIKADLVEKIDD
jgi:hypothetical protein